MAFFDDAPKLSPYSNIFLKRRDCQSDVVLLNIGDVTAPFQERHIFLLLDLVCRHGPVPGGSSRNSQRYIVTRDFLLLISEEDLDHGDRVLGVISPTLYDMRVGEDNLTVALSLEVFGTELSQLDEFFEGVLLEDRDERPLAFTLLLVCRVL